MSLVPCAACARHVRAVEPSSAGRRSSGPLPFNGKAMRARSWIGLGVGLAAGCALVVWSLGSILKAGGGATMAVLLVYSLLSLHFLARLAAPRQRSYVERWRVVIRVIAGAGPLAALADGMVSRGFDLSWLVLLAVAGATSAGTWLALSGRLERSGETAAAGQPS